MTALLRTALAAAALLLTVPALAQEPTVSALDLKVLDADGDSVVSLAEYRLLLSEIFIDLDADADNAIAVADLAPALTREQLAAVDADGDGTVTRAEYDAVTLAEFATVDDDGDGLLPTAN